MLTNFSNKYKHMNKGTIVGCIDEIIEATDSRSLILENLLRGTKLFTQLLTSI